MGKPEKKLKKIIVILGIAAAVYGSFRFLLPLAVPFLFAWGAAAALTPSAEWIRARCNHKLPLGLIGMVELLLITSVLLALLLLGGRRLCQEACLLAERIPDWIHSLDVWLTGLCYGVEEAFCLRRGCLVLLMRQMLRGLAATVTGSAMPFLMTNSVTVFRFGVETMVFTVIFFLSTGLALQEKERWSLRWRRSLFCDEAALIGKRLKTVICAYGKAQVIIMFFTTVVCVAGFCLMKNPYYILLGMGVGLVDALPVFGTGTLLIPWAVLCFFRRQVRQGLMLLVLYVICYFLREILEAKLMGDRLGLSPLETLLSMYVGLKLFGIAGFILGPIGLLLIEDLTVYAQQQTDG